MTIRWIVIIRLIVNPTGDNRIGTSDLGPTSGAGVRREVLAVGVVFVCNKRHEGIGEHAPVV